MQAHSDGTGSIVAVGEILWDLLPAGPRLGGTTANFAIGCARLGRRASLISSLGADNWGERAREVLHGIQQRGAELLDTSLIQTATHPTGLVEVTLNADGHPQYNIAMPAAWDEIRATPESVAEVKAARAVCFGTLGQRDQHSREAIRALILGTPAECLRVLDVNVRAPFFNDEVARWSLQHCTVAKISEEELAEVARAVGAADLCDDQTALSQSAIERCARGLLERHPGLELIAITMGPRGSLLLTPDDVHYHPGFAIQVVDTVGAGDAFTAGLVHAWLAGAGLAAVNEVGNLCGSFVASQPGATPEFPAGLLAKVEAALGADRPGPR